MAFDLDGVLTPDMRVTLEYLPMINSVRLNHIQPIIQPVSLWSIVTSRSLEDRSSVLQWVEQEFTFPPREVIFNTGQELPEVFKTNTINAHPEFFVFVESDFRTFRYIKENVKTGCKIVHFNSLILETLESL